MLLGVLFVSCSNIQTVNTPYNTENLPTLSKENTPTKTSTSTITPTTFTTTPTIEPTSTPSPLPATLERATIRAFGALCANIREIFKSEISPNGKWIAIECIGENETQDSPLRVTSIDHSKDWKIYYRDYIKGNQDYGSKNIIIPYRWSKDGKFLYTVSPTNASGCCWIGGKYVLLVRLNLETGEQIELLNASDPSSHSPLTFTISDNDRYLIYNSSTTQEYGLYDFAILDLLSQKTQVIKLKFLKYINLDFAVMSLDENKIVMPLFENVEFNDFRVVSICLIDLTTGKQELLISDLKQENELYPIRWVDADHVLLSNANPDVWYDQASAEYWLLDIHTSQLVKTEKP